jgi:hypothetical protein
MKYGLAFFLFTVIAGSLALPQSSTTPAKPAVKKAAQRTAPATKKTAASKKGKSSSSKKPPAAAAAAWSHQSGPTPERYKEIQQALADKGYLQSEPNGVWDAQSTDAMLRFQNDKKLSPTGKLSAASLIALGLGPKTPDTALSSADATGDPVVTPPIVAPPAAPPVTSPEN